VSIEKQYNIYLFYSSCISLAFLLLPLLLAVINRKNLNKKLSIFLGYGIIALLVVILHVLFVWQTSTYFKYWESLLIKWQIGDTNFMSILAYLNTYLLLGYYFSEEIYNKKYQSRILLLFGCIAIIGIIDYLFITGFRNYGYFNPIASSSLAIVFSLISLRAVFQKDTLVPIAKNTYFWFALGILVPNAIGLFLRLAGNAIYGDDFILYCKVSMAKDLFFDIAQVLIMIGFYRSRFVKCLDSQGDV
jgi:hypothetical protein